MEDHCDQQESRIKELEHIIDGLEEELESAREELRRKECQSRKGSFQQMLSNAFGFQSDSNERE